MNPNNSNNQQKPNTTTVIATSGSHLIILIAAVFLAYHCNKGTSNMWLHIIVAFLCPQCYILYVLLMKKECIICNAKVTN